MPAAAVLFLQAQQDGALYGATGQHAHGFWLTTWRGIAAEVGDALHDDRPLRQFTISPLLGLPPPARGRTEVRAGDSARLRLTALDDRIESELLGRWLLRLPDEVAIGGVIWQVQRLALSPDDHPAAGRAAYEALRARRLNRPPDRRELVFESPTAFHLQDGTYLPFPLPERLVAGWLNRWNEYSPVPLLPPGEPVAGFLERIAVGLRVSRYELKTVSFRFRREGPGGRRVELPQIGCVGRVALDASALNAADRSIAASLTDFAFYCGSGHHTTMGMGQTRVVDSE